MVQVVNLKFDGQSLISAEDIMADNLSKDHVQRYLAYDPKVNVQRYPWKTEQKAPANDAPQSPRSLSEFDKIGFLFESAFPDNCNPFRQSKNVKGDEDLVEKSQSLPVQEKVNAKEDRIDPKASIYAKTSWKVHQSREGKTAPEIYSHRLSYQSGFLSTFQEDQVGVERKASGRGIISVDDPGMSKLKLHIDDYNETTFIKIIEELHSNDRVTKLHICRSWVGEKGRTRSPKDLALLFEAIHTIPKLELLRLSNFEAYDLEDLYDAIDANPTLMTFRLRLSELHF
jgi:hypothetical protein